MLQIQETYVNETDGHIIGESDWYEPYTDNRGRLFREMQRDYGRCVSKMYRDVPMTGETETIGWVFSKRMQYEDCARTYIREVWVHVRTVKDGG